MWVIWKVFLLEWWVSVQQSRVILVGIQFSANNKIAFSPEVLFAVSMYT